jgi:hypothetical protein
MAKEKKKQKGNNQAARSAQNILGGTFLTKEYTARHLPFLLFLAFVAIIYIGNSYYAEKNIRKIERLQKELKEMRYEHITYKSQVNKSTSQSQVANSLRNNGIKESTVPPNKIFVKD